MVPLTLSEQHEANLRRDDYELMIVELSSPVCPNSGVSIYMEAAR